MNKTLAQIAAAALSASFLVSVWEPFRQSGNVWFALVPLLLLARHVSPRRAFWLGWLTGAAAWVGQLWWMLRLADNGGPWPLVVPALVGLSTLLGLFVGAFAACAASLRRGMPAHNEEKGFLLFRARAHDPGATPDTAAVAA